jgi:hypothetical protein
MQQLLHIAVRNGINLPGGHPPALESGAAVAPGPFTIGGDGVDSPQWVSNTDW